MTRRATSAGRCDGIVHATLGRPCDPTGGFIKRPELSDDERAAYVKAYDAGYREQVESDRHHAAGGPRVTAAEADRLLWDAEVWS